MLLSWASAFALLGAAGPMSTSVTAMLRAAACGGRLMRAAAPPAGECSPLLHSAQLWLPDEVLQL